MTVPVTQKEQCMLNLVALLETITVANGYFIGIETGNVEREIRDIDDPLISDRLPWIGMAEGINEDIEELMGDLSHHTFDVLLVSYISELSLSLADRAVPTNKVCNAWAKAITACIASDVTLGQYAIRVRAVKFSTNQGEIFVDGNWVRAILMDLEVQYQSTRSSKSD